jgi:hypothetical protein
MLRLWSSNRPNSICLGGRSKNKKISAYGQTQTVRIVKSGCSKTNRFCKQIRIFHRGKTDFYPEMESSTLSSQSTSGTEIRLEELLHPTTHFLRRFFIPCNSKINFDQIPRKFQVIITCTFHALFLRYFQVYCK